MRCGGTAPTPLSRFVSCLSHIAVPSQKYRLKMGIRILGAGAIAQEWRPLPHSSITSNDSAKEFTGNKRRQVEICPTHGLRRALLLDD